MAVVIETNVGDFTVDLYTDERPQTCRNFLKLCKIKYYNFSLFMNVQTNFIAQTGDPSKTGKGGESIYGIIMGEKARYYQAEQVPKIKHEKAGLLSMVNCGDNMLGSQFFITLASDLQSLDGHCVFGEISEGLEVILKFNETICDEDHRPYQDIRISHTVILEDPYDDPEGLIVPDRSPEPTKELLQSDRIGADEEINDTEGMTLEEVAEMHKEKEAKARATILEIVGDIPDADMAPPENVLFVCKLNPVTNDDDLEIIFSRFGKIVGCEVIRDRQTGDSLQYAFIEFADPKSCEEAYFKMDNVLIDDRRIHVDFSQSVAKMRWGGKGKGIKYFTEDEIQEKERNNKESNKDDKRNRGEKRRSRSESPKKNKNRQESKDNYETKKDDRKRYESSRNGDSKKQDDLDRKSSRKRRERSRSFEKKRNRKDRSRSREKIKERRERSRSRSRSRSKKMYKDRKERSKSKEQAREKRERSTERSKERKKRSRSREKVRKERSKSREKTRKERSRSRDRIRDKKGRSRERSTERNRERSHKKSRKSKR